jgi:hypothetical protein
MTDYREFSLIATLEKLVMAENAAPDAATDLQMCLIAAVAWRRAMLMQATTLNEIYANAAEEAALAEAQQEMPFQRMH